MIPGIISHESPFIFLDMHQNEPQLPVMGHLVLGYPTLADSLKTAETYVRAGIEILELQIPFSHPTADGPVITAACREAVENQKVTVQQCIEAVASLRTTFPEQEIMVMSYVNRLYAYGFGRFAAEMQRLGVKHIIVPDLPVDSPTAAELMAGGVQLVPVLAANISDARLQMLLDRGFDFFYLMSDFKITGSGFSLNPRLTDIIQTIKAAPQMPRVGIGFGISTPGQAQLIAEAADVAIIGSALIQAQQEGRLDAYLADLQGVLSSF